MPVSKTRIIHSVEKQVFVSEMAWESERVSAAVKSRTVSKRATYRNFEINKLKSGTIQIFRDGAFLKPVKPFLRDLAVPFGVDKLNGNGNEKNTRQLGDHLIKAIAASSAES